MAAAEVIGEWLYAATPAREILRFDGCSRETVVAAAPGDVAGLAGSESALVAGTTAGLLRDEDGEISTQAGAVTAVCVRGVRGVGSARGRDHVERVRPRLAPGGVRARSGPGGPVAVNRDGA